MKLIISDLTGAEHDLDSVVLGIAGDIHRLNQRLMRVEAEAGIVYQDAEAEAIKDAEEDHVGSEESI
jgi:hypothetical protein